MPCPLGRVSRQVVAYRLNQLWVAGFTYVSTWQGWPHVAFVVSVFSLDALEPVFCARQADGPERLVHHSVKGMPRSATLSA